ncbi:hypothetical protein ACKS0A_07069 [Histoplasma ohiense]
MSVHMTIVPDGHAFTFYSFDGEGLNYFAPFPTQLDDMAVQVCDVARPVSHPRFSETENFSPKQVVILPSEERTISSVVLGFENRWFPLLKINNQIAGYPVGAFVCLVFKRYLGSFGHPPLYRH